MSGCRSGVATQLLKVKGYPCRLAYMIQKSVYSYCSNYTNKTFLHTRCILHRSACTTKSEIRAHTQIAVGWFVSYQTSRQKSGFERALAPLFSREWHFSASSSVLRKFFSILLDTPRTRQKNPLFYSYFTAALRISVL